MNTLNYLKIPLFFLTIGVLASCSYDNDLESQGLNGKIKFYTERCFKAEKNLEEWERGEAFDRGHSRVYYNKKGNVQLQQELGRELDIVGKYIFISEKGVILEQEYYNSDGELRSKTKYISNSKDEREYISYNKDGEIMAKGKLYYANNRIIKEIYQPLRDNEVVEEYTTIREYDQTGKIINRKTVDSKGKIHDNSKMEYFDFDEHNNWTKALLNYLDEDEEPIVVLREYQYY